MQVPASMSEKQRSILKENLRIIQKCLHSVNPFINDFKQILEIPSSELAEGKIIISAKGPLAEHVRKYNLPTNLKEVSIVTNS